MSFTLKQALEFNKFTTGLAAAGLAFVGSIASEGPATHVSIKYLGTFGVLLLAVSVISGALVIGRASKISAKEDAILDDRPMKACGQVHSGTLVAGLVVASLLMLNKIWKFL